MNRKKGSLIKKYEKNQLMSLELEWLEKKAITQGWTFNAFEFKDDRFLSFLKESFKGDFIPMENYDFDGHKKERMTIQSLISMCYWSKRNNYIGLDSKQEMDLLNFLHYKRDCFALLDEKVNNYFYLLLYIIFFSSNLENQYKSV